MLATSLSYARCRIEVRHDVFGEYLTPLHLDQNWQNIKLVPVWFWLVQVRFILKPHRSLEPYLI
jgi:hypothetical protein